MPEVGTVSRSIDCWSYNTFDGGNTTQGVFTWKWQTGEKTSASIGTGLMTNCKDNGGAVIEGKINYKPHENINLQFRDKHVISAKANTAQYRLSSEFSKDVGNGVTVYGTPYVACKLDYDTGKNSFDNGIFAGVKYKFSDKVSGSIEAQRYHLIGGSNSTQNWGVNAGISITM